MGKKDDRVDTYIDKQADFAKPILTHLRGLIHDACPEVQETIKWGFPHYDYKGIMVATAGFKKHCALTFWKGSLMKDEHKVMETVGKTAMGQFGKIGSFEDLPDDSVITSYVIEAAQLNADGVKLPTAANTKKKRELDIPDYFMDAIKKNKKSLETFEGFSYSNKKEYVEWVTGAKTEPTREKRLATTVEWLAEGKIKNWKYVNC